MKRRGFSGLRVVLVGAIGRGPLLCNIVRAPSFEDLFLVPEIRRNDKGRLFLLLSLKNDS